MSSKVLLRDLLTTFAESGVNMSVGVTTSFALPSWKLSNEMKKQDKSRVTIALKAVDKHIEKQDKSILQNYHSRASTIQQQLRSPTVPGGNEYYEEQTRLLLEQTELKKELDRVVGDCCVRLRMIIYDCANKEELNKCKQKTWAAKPISIGSVEKYKIKLQIST